MRPPFKLAVPIQVRFRDTDAMGHVNNAVYLTYLEIARTVYWHRLFGIESYNNVDFILARAEIDFLAPIMVHDQAEVWMRVSELGNRSFRCAYEMVRGPAAEPVMRAETVLVMYDYASGKTKPLSDDQRRTILEFEEPGAVKVRA